MEASIEQSNASRPSPRQRRRRPLTRERVLREALRLVDEEGLRSIARCLRWLSHTHPNAFPLILSSTSFAESMLSTLATGLATLEDAGFDRDRSAPTLTAVIHYALGYAMMEGS